MGCESCRSCHANESIYEVLQVANLVNISEVTDYKSKYGIENVINQLKMRIDFGGNVTILTEDAKNELQNLARSNITRINFSQFAEVVSGLAPMESGLCLLCGISVLNIVSMKMALRNVSFILFCPICCCHSPIAALPYSPCTCFALVVLLFLFSCSHFDMYMS